MRRTRASLEALRREVDDFNARCPVGTRVRYWKGAREGPGQVSRTRSQADVLGEHTPVVWLEGVSGCIALSHVEVLEEEAA